MKVKTYPFIRSIGSYLIPDKYFVRPGSGGTYSSLYCYSVWLRHLKVLANEGLIDGMDDIKKVAEIGPGDSLGIGISALLSGASEYHGFDVIRHANIENNIRIAEDIKFYFKERLDIPYKEDQFRNTRPFLDNYNFPEVIPLHFINDENIEERFQEIKKALKGSGKRIKVEYVVPWYEKNVALGEQIDLIFSQAVMEHVMDIEHAYTAMYNWLKQGGIISHVVDFQSHEMTKEWNGHWFINNKIWKFLLHGRKYPINRYPLSAHIKEIENAGFTIKNIIQDKKKNPFPNRKPKVKNCNYTQKDKVTASALIQAVK